MEKLLHHITAIIAICGFVFSVWKYIDLKEREEKRLLYENYSKLLDSLSGKILDNGRITIEISFLIGCIYKLLEFPQYKKISLPVLIYMKECPIKTDEKSIKFVENVIDEVIKQLKQ